VSSGTSIADLSRRRSRLRLTGSDRVTFLQGQCTNDIQRLHVGDSCYAAFLNAKGMMRGEGHIICQTDAFLLEVSEGLHASLEKFIITEDVVVEDVSAPLLLYLVVRSEQLAIKRDDDHESAHVDRPTLPAGAVTFVHPLGLGVISPVVLPVTLDAPTLDARRIEAGIPQWGVDMDENTIPVEAGLAERAISYEKGCYIGQETIARIKTYGHVNRHLVQLAIAGDRLPVAGERILAAGKEAGRVTSAARSNRLGKMLALGYVRREFAVTGVKLIVGEQSAEVLKICGQ
jgi:folate-binding protein YgfZ